MNSPVAGPPWLDERLKRGEVVILDGAMGTELEARGVPMNNAVWSGAAHLEHIDTAREIHEDYIRAGADVIITNTFSSGRHSLEPAGFGDQVAEINRCAVEAARMARDNAADRPVAIAGSICEEARNKETGWGAAPRLAQSLREQADLLAEAGVELITLEMAQSSADSHLALEAAQSTGLPVWVGCSCRRRPGIKPLGTFDDDMVDGFEELVAGLAALKPAVMTVMHSPIADTPEGLQTVRRHWSGPLGAYPESGYFIMPNWQFVDIIAPDDLVAEARGWVVQGAQLIGGCCGLGPDHIRALKAGLPDRLDT